MRCERTSSIIIHVLLNDSSTGLIKTLLVQTLLREKIQVKERVLVYVPKSTIIHLKVGGTPYPRYEFST